MDFANEEYRRLYVRDTITWKRLGWAGQNVLTQILRKMDRSGVLELGGMEPAEAVALVTGGPVDEIETGLGRLLHLEVLKRAGDALVWPRFLEAQTVNKSDRQRQRESRDKRRSSSLDLADHVTKRDAESQNVTESHTRSHAVTASHTPSQAVTLSSAQQSESQQSAAQSTAARDDWKVGYDWFVAAFLGGDVSQAPNAVKWRDDYAVLGRRSEADRAMVAKVASADPWVIANRGGSANPGHFVKHWGKYASGGQKVVARPASSTEVAQADREAAVASRAKAARDDFNARIRAAKAEGDTYTADILAAERDHVVSRIQAKAS